MNWFNAHGNAVSVVPGAKIPARRDTPPHATACRIDISDPPTAWTITPNEDDDSIVRLSYIRKGSTEYLFPHWGSVQQGQRLCTGWQDATLSNRYFRRHLLRSGGYTLATTAASTTLYVGIGEDGYLSLIGEPYPWFFVSIN
jgi:hypothetical protein